jgi:lysozyme
MRASERCIQRLMLLEGYTPVAKHLPGDRPNVITGGFGDTKVTLGETHTREEWEARLRKRVVVFEDYVNGGVAVPLTQAQFDALVLFVYNVGPGAPKANPPIDGFLTSTLRIKLNNGDFAGAKAEFKRWNKSNGEIQPGLISRRAAEADLFGQDLPKAA